MDAMRCEKPSTGQRSVRNQCKTTKKKWRVENGRMRVRIRNQSNERRKEKKKNSGEHTQQRNDRIGNVEAVKTMRLGHPATRATD